jgi:hypothetical protein
MPAANAMKPACSDQVRCSWVDRKAAVPNFLGSPSGGSLEEEEGVAGRLLKSRFSFLVADACLVLRHA